MSTEEDDAKQNIQEVSDSRLTENLINVLKEHECLYDPKHEQHSNGHARRHAWKLIAEKTGESVARNKSRWHRARDYFRRCYRRQLEAERSNRRCDIPWSHYDRMAFLKPYILEQLEPQKELKIETVWGTTDPEPNVELRSESDDDNIVLADIARNRNHKNKSNNRVNDTTQGDADETELFFLCIARDVRKLPLPVQQKLKFQIHELIYTAQCANSVNLNDTF